MPSYSYHADYTEVREATYVFSTGRLPIATDIICQYVILLMRVASDGKSFLASYVRIFCTIAAHSYSNKFVI